MARLSYSLLVAVALAACVFASHNSVAIVKRSDPSSQVQSDISGIAQEIGVLTQAIKGYEQGSADAVYNDMGDVTNLLQAAMPHFEALPQKKLAEADEDKVHQAVVGFSVAIGSALKDIISKKTSFLAAGGMAAPLATLDSAVMAYMDAMENAFSSRLKSVSIKIIKQGLDISFHAVKDEFPGP